MVRSVLLSTPVTSYNDRAIIIRTSGFKEATYRLNPGFGGWTARSTYDSRTIPCGWGLRPRIWYGQIERADCAPRLVQGSSHHPPPERPQRGHLQIAEPDVEGARREPPTTREPFLVAGVCDPGFGMGGSNVLTAPLASYKFRTIILRSSGLKEATYKSTPDVEGWAAARPEADALPLTPDSVWEGRTC